LTVVLIDDAEKSTTEQVISLALGVAPGDQPLCVIVGSGLGPIAEQRPAQAPPGVAPAGTVDPRALVGPAFAVRYAESMDFQGDWLIEPDARPLDCIIVIPPWGTRRPDGEDDLHMALRAVAPLAHSFPVGVLVPHGWLASRQSRAGASEVVRDQLRTVVFLDDSDGVLPGISSHLDMALLVLDQAESADSLLRIFKVPRSGSAPRVEIIDDLQRLLRRKGGRGRWGYVLRDPIEADAPLTFERYDPRIQKRSEEIGTLGGSSTANGIFEVLMSRVQSPRNASEASEGAIGVVSGRCLTAGGLDLEERRFVDRDPQSPALRPGDICLRRDRASAEQSVHACVIPEGLTNLTWASNVVVLRLREDVALSDATYFAEFLNSQRATELLSVGGPGFHLSMGVLRSLPLPPIDELTCF
jgi:hypothetical protein